MRSLLIFAILASTFDRIRSNPPNFNYDFSGLHKLTGLLPTNCNDIEGQVIKQLGGIQKPTHNYNHIQCAADEDFGTRIKFIIHRDLDDDAVTGDTHKQRLEMHTRFRNDLHAKHGSTFVYAWWFFLSSSIVADKSYWHIFQIKASGANVDPNPTLTFTLRSRQGLEIDFSNDHSTGGQYIPMLDLKAATGKWIQAYVKIKYSESGFADIYLKDIHGTQLFHKKISGNFWWDGAEYYGPKWGLYRAKSPIFNDSDYCFFQNVQIWKQ